MTHHERIVEYYRQTEHAYADAWDLERSGAIHYGYSDEKARSFSASLIRMNEVMCEAVQIQHGASVLDAGCGIGGSSIFLADTRGCSVTGITLSERQAEKARSRTGDRDNIRSYVKDFCNTGFPDCSFDVVWGCESICYAENKLDFIREAARILKPGGRLIVADGFVTESAHNNNLIIRRWLDGWEVPSLETPLGFETAMHNSGFSDINYRDITKNIIPSAKRLYRVYFLASLYLRWRKLRGGRQPTEVQIANIKACRYQFIGLKKGLWQYGLIYGTKN